MNSLRMYYQNVRGLNTKIRTGIRNRTTLFDYDIYALTETWIQENIESSEIFDDNYVVHRYDRKLSNEFSGGGGVLLAIKRHISAIRMNNWENEIPFENIWLRINSNGGKNLYINVIYLRSGFRTEHLNIYLNHISEVILAREPDSDFLIIGDFNLSCINWINMGNHCIASDTEGNNATNLIDTFMLTGIDQRNYLLNKYGKILDLVISNFNVHIKNASEIICKEDDYHPSLSIRLEFNRIQFMKPIKTWKRNFTKANFEIINDRLSIINWNKELDHENINTAVEKFYYIVNNVINNHVPFTKPRSVDFPKWFSNYLINRIHEKEKYHKLYKRHQTEAYKELFKAKRREVKYEKKKCYFNYFNNIETLVETNPKSFFAYTKSLKQSNNLPGMMQLKNEQTTNIKDTCNLFAKHFASVYIIPDGDNLMLRDVDETFMTANSNVIEKIIRSFDQNKLNSPDLIPMIFYMNTASNISEALSILFNLSIKTRKFPDKWKESLITPIYKSGEKSNIENYRPVSIISAASKIFERYLFNYIHDKTREFISDSQHGFSIGKSTLTNLMEYSDYLAENMIGGNQVDTIFTDMSKAFDKINHNTLLKKLETYGLNMGLIRLIESFLKGRVQRVCVHGAKSIEINPTSSVPQGSVLSPLLFVLFINDLPENIKCKILMFADDVKIYNRISGIDDARKLQNDLVELTKWCTINGLSLNTSKCYVMTTTRKLAQNVSLFNYNINGTPLNKVNSFKDLGVIFDSKFTFENQINSLITRSFKILGFLARSLNKFNNIKTYNILYNTYVRSILEYCSPIWSPHYATYIERIERVQRRFTKRIFYKFHFPMEKYEMRLIRLNMLSLEDRRLMFDELTLFKMLNNIIYTSIAHKINLNNPIRSMRRVNTFYLPFVTSNIEFFSTIVRIQRQHNEIFDSLALTNNSLNSFRNKVITDLYDHRPIEY